jgi:phenylalanyl-tRNA synthetase beta chain
MRIAAAAFGPAFEEQWGVAARNVDFHDVKADLEALAAPLAVRLQPAQHPAFHPGRSAEVLLDGVAAGWIGELHPRWQRKYELPLAPVLFELEAEALTGVPLPRSEMPSKYPPVVRDMAIVADAGISAQALLDALQAEKPPIVRTISIFDLYQGPNLPERAKSIAFRVVMQHTERTLTDAEADAARDALVDVLSRRFSATLRK